VLEKYINANYSIIVIFFEKEVNSPMKRSVEKKLVEKKPRCLGM
jgi:hypothetical protein